MGIAEIIMAIIAAIGVVVSAGVSGYQAVQNKKSVEETNETNLQAVRETNQSNVEQAELAYKRSLPTAQVKHLIDAGFSRAGALGSLSGAGSYTAPVLQSAHGDAPQMDFSGIAGAMDRMTNIPVNVEQSQLVEEQRKALQVQTDEAIKEGFRKQEQHNFDMWQKTYGKKATEMIDALSSEIVSLAGDKGISLDEIDSPDKLRKAFNLDSNQIWRNMPTYARNQVLESVRLQAAENRAIAQQNNANLASSDAHKAAQDAHKKAMDDLKTSELGRQMTKKQIEKISSDTLKLNMEILDYNDESDARQKEYKLREARASFLSLAQEFDLKIEELRQDFYFDENGEPKLKTLNTLKAKEFWNMVAKTIGLESIGDILRGIFSVATKG